MKNIISWYYPPFWMASSTIQPSGAGDRDQSQHGHPGIDREDDEYIWSANTYLAHSNTDIHFFSRSDGDWYSDPFSGRCRASNE